MLEPEKTLPGMPVAVVISIRNLGPAPIEILTPFFLEEETVLRVDVEDPEGVQRRVQPRIVYSNPLVRRVTLPGFSSYLSKEWLFLDHQGKVFKSPGVNRVKARVRPLPDGKWIEIPPADIVILEPTEREVEAARLLDCQEIADRFSPGEGRRFSSKEVLERLRRLESEYCDTPYSKYGQYLLAIHEGESVFLARSALARLGIDLATVEQRQRDVLCDLQDLRRTDPPDNIRQEIDLDLARYYTHRADRDNAMTHLGKLGGEDLPEPLLRIRKRIEAAWSKPPEGDSAEE